MNSFPNRPINRRGFFLTAARAAALLALAAFAAWQETKRRRLANDPNCLKLSVCSDCVEFGRCTKSKAQAARQSGSRPRRASNEKSGSGSRVEPLPLRFVP